VAELDVVAPPFIEMAHRIVWCAAATVDTRGRPRSRILHPIWQWDGESLRGWIATNPISTKRRHLDRHPYLSLNYWASNHDTCLAECTAEWKLDDDSRAAVWQRFVHGPPPVGYDPTIVPGWETPGSPTFGALELVPWRVRVMPGTVMTEGRGQLLVWQDGQQRRR
jgi:hypothetical protein